MIRKKFFGTACASSGRNQTGFMASIKILPNDTDTKRKLFGG
jgi:hypothetical protein